MKTDSNLILIVDDDASIQNALGRLLASAGYATATFEGGQELLANPLVTSALCLILDVDMPGMNGLEVQRELFARNFRLPIIFLTGHGDIPMSVYAIKAGAVDFLSKPCDGDTLLTAVSNAVASYRQNHEQRAHLQEEETLLSSLTAREHEVMVGVVEGKLNKQIADDLGIAEKTVKVHRGRVMKKLGVQSIADLVRLTFRHSE